MTAIKKHIKIYKILLIALIITLLPPTAVHASTKSDITPLLNVMHNFIYYSICNNIGTAPKKGKNYTIKMNAQNMLTASALSTKYYNNEILEQSDVDPWYTIYKLSSSKLKKRCKNLFGKTASVSALQNKQNRYVLWTLFQQSGHPYLYINNAETDTDLIRTSLTIKKTGSGTYTVKEGVYYGHWGAVQNKTATTNYVITYKIQKNTDSSFGFVIKKMKLKRTR